MDEELKSQRLETQALVLGYTMSRLDQNYLARRHLASWRAAYSEAGSILAKPPATFKNLRDEFDPFHPNTRRGWHGRPIRPSRQRILDELSEVSEEALLEIVRYILSGKDEAIHEAMDALAVVTHKPAHVAERLLTGRRAEEYFLENSRRLVGLTSEDLLDKRESACGFDFGVAHCAAVGIEVKGLKKEKGDILFTDREWQEAQVRRQSYLLVVVGNLEREPAARVFVDPYESVGARCLLEPTVRVTWRAGVSVHG